MGYKIQYGGKTQRGWKAYRWIFFALMFCVAALSVQILWPDAIEAVYRLWVPQALETLADMLKEGTDLGDAVAAFCQGIGYGQ